MRASFKPRVFIVNSLAIHLKARCGLLWLFLSSLGSQRTFLARLNTAFLSFGTITYLPWSFFSNMVLTICDFLAWAPHPLPISLVMYSCSFSVKSSNTLSKCLCLRRFLRCSTSMDPAAAAGFLPTFTFCNYVFQGELAWSPSFGKRKKDLLQKLPLLKASCMTSTHQSTTH